LSPRLPSGIAALLAAATLAGCGGGLYIAVGDDDFDTPPRVSLVASAERASPGQPLRLAAAASDDHGVQRVQFYRLEPGGGATLLGSDTGAPFDWDTTLPATSASEVRYYARAFDFGGQSSDSDTVTVTVQR
jgi:hypothetical protein